MQCAERVRWAVIHGNLPIVQRLLRRFPDLIQEADPANGWTLLHYAGYYGQYVICVHLIQHGHDRDEISLDHRRNTPLHLAAWQNHEQTVHYLAQHMTRCLDWRNNDYETALMMASRAGNDPCITLLLDFGADINLSDNKGNRPIHVAAQFGHVKALRTLIGRNADSQSPNLEGWKPIQYCSTYHVQDYLQSLIHEKGENNKRQQAFFKPATTTRGKEQLNSSPKSTTTTTITQSVSSVNLLPAAPSTGYKKSSSSNSLSTVLGGSPQQSGSQTPTTDTYPNTLTYSKRPSPRRSSEFLASLSLASRSPPSLSPKHFSRTSKIDHLKTPPPPPPLFIPPRRSSLSSLPEDQKVPESPATTLPLPNFSHALRTSTSTSSISSDSSIGASQLPSPQTPVQSHGSAETLARSSPGTRSRVLDVSVSNVRQNATRNSSEHFSFL